MDTAETANAPGATRICVRMDIQGTAVMPEGDSGRGRFLWKTHTSCIFTGCFDQSLSFSAYEAVRDELLQGLAAHRPGRALSDCARGWSGAGREGGGRPDCVFGGRAGRAGAADRAVFPVCVQRGMRGRAGRRGGARGVGICRAEWARIAVHGGGRAGALRVCGARGRGGLRVPRGIRGRAFAGRCAARDARVHAGRLAVRQRARGVFRCVAGARVRVHDSGRRVFGHLPPERVYERGRVAVRRSARGRARRGIARGELSGRRAQPRRYEARAL